MTTPSHSEFRLVNTMLCTRNSNPLCKLTKYVSAIETESRIQCILCLVSFAPFQGDPDLRMRRTWTRPVFSTRRLKSATACHGDGRFAGNDFHLAIGCKTSIPRSWIGPMLLSHPLIAPRCLRPAQRSDVARGYTRVRGRKRCRCTSRRICG